MMIVRIVVGRGNRRTVVETLPGIRQFKSIGNALRGHLFNDAASYQQAKARGAHALREAAHG